MMYILTPGLFNQFVVLWTDRPGHPSTCPTLRFDGSSGGRGTGNWLAFCCNTASRKLGIIYASRHFSWCDISPKCGFPAHLQRFEKAACNWVHQFAVGFFRSISTSQHQMENYSWKSETILCRCTIYLSWWSWLLCIIHAEQRFQHPKNVAGREESFSRGRNQGPQWRNHGPQWRNHEKRSNHCYAGEKNFRTRNGCGIDRNQNPSSWGKSDSFRICVQIIREKFPIALNFLSPVQQFSRQGLAWQIDPRIVKGECGLYYSSSHVWHRRGSSSSGQGVKKLCTHPVQAVPRPSFFSGRGRLYWRRNSDYCDAGHVPSQAPGPRAL